MNNIDKFKKLWLGYTESAGDPALTEQIAALYSDITPEQILVHSGAEEAIFNTMNVLLEKGDHIIVHYPCYQSLMEIAKAIGCDVTLWETHSHNQWALDLDFLKDHIRSNTRLVIINTPHNPTGYLMPRADMDEVAKLSRQHGFVVFSDEVYRESEFHEEDRLPAACDFGEHAVSLGVMSKTYGLPGLRIGWIATRNAAVYDGMAALKDYTTICNSAPSEFLAELALHHRKALVERNLGIIADNLKVLDRFFERHAARFSWQRPQAGSIGFPRLLGQDVEAFCEDLVNSAGVLLLPGTLYGDDGNHFRIGFGRRNMPEAIGRLEQFLQ